MKLFKTRKTLTAEFGSRQRVTKRLDYFHNTAEKKEFKRRKKIKLNTKRLKTNEQKNA